MSIRVSIGAGGGTLTLPSTIKVVGSFAGSVAATAHGVGDNVGGKITFAAAVADAAGGGTIQSAVLRDADGQDLPYDLVLFDADPSAATITDDAAFVFSTDISKCCGVIEFAGMAKGGTPGVFSMKGLGLQFTLASGTTLYGALVTRGGATYTGTPAVSIVLYIIPE